MNKYHAVFTSFSMIWLMMSQLHASNNSPIVVHELNESDFANVTQEQPSIISLVLDGDIDANLYKLPLFFSNLKNLSLQDTDLGDKGMPHLVQMTQLQSLNLSTRFITDNSLQYLPTNLTNLNLSYTTITGEQLEHLNLCQKLKELNIEGTNIGFFDPHCLLKLSSLKNLQIKDPRIVSSETK